MRALLLPLTLLLAAGCGVETAQDAPEAEDGPAEAAMPRVDGPPAPFQLTERQARGRLVFESVCWTCHGKGGQGDGPAVDDDSVPPPPNYHTTSGIAQASVEELLARFEGSFEGLDEDHPHMASVFALVKPEAFLDALTYIPALLYPDGIPGSALAGQAEYQRLCQACHGAQGEGNGDAAATLLVEPANFHADTLIAAEDWEAVFQRIRQGQGVHGSNMPPWGRMLSDAEIWNLVAYVATFQPEHVSAPPTGGGTAGG